METTKDWRDYPVYVSGTAKSGTTLLLDLLDGTPSTVSIPDEPSFTKILKRDRIDLATSVRDYIHCYSAFGVRKNVLLNKMVSSGYADVKDYGDFVAEEISINEGENQQLTIRGLERWPEFFDAETYYRTLKVCLARANDKKDILTGTAEAVRLAQALPSEGLRRWIFKETFDGGG